jgi:hypothetical protein
MTATYDLDCATAARPESRARRLLLSLKVKPIAAIVYDKITAPAG